MRFALAALVSAAVVSLSAPAWAAIKVYAGPALGVNEVPPNASAGSGFGTVTIDTDLSTVRVEATFQNLSSPASAAHIHCCAAPGSNAGVLLGLANFPNVSSGSYDRTFTVAAVAFGNLVAGLDAGTAYLNIHNLQFTGGELRANLAPIPEPSTYALMLAGLAGLGFVARRRKT